MKGSLLVMLHRVHHCDVWHLTCGRCCCRLCKLLTSPVTEIKDLVAHYLFILCKENGQCFQSGHAN